MTVVGDTLRLGLRPQSGESRVHAHGDQEKEQQQRYPHARVSRQDRQERPGGQKQRGKVKETLKRRQHDVGRQHTDAIQHSNEHQQPTRTGKTDPHHEQSCRARVTPVTIPVP